MRIAPFLLLAVSVGTWSCQSTGSPAPGSPAMTTNDADRDLHSFARPGEVRVRHLELDLELDFAKAEIRGSCTLHLVRTVADAPLWLDCDGLVISRVTAGDGATLAFELGPRDPLLGTPLRIALRPGDDRVCIDYATGEDAAAVQWLQPEQTSGSQPFLFTQGQAILTRTWIPLQDSPAVRATWQARIRAPRGLRPLMSADQRGGDAVAGWTFAMTRPVPSYLIALACGELEQRAISDRCAVWAEPAVVDGARAELEDMERMVAACEELFGAYRWGRYDVLFLPSSFPFGGMENPCMTFATPTILAGDKSLVALIAHELAHSWSGNLVTNATWRDFWLNEGFTVYLEQRIMEHVYGRERATMEIALSMRQLAQELRSLPKPDTVLHLDLAGRNPDDGMTAIAYDKGAAFLRRLEELYGRDRFDRFLRSWFDRHAFQSVTTAVFREWLKRELLAQDEGLAALVDVPQWIEQPGLPEDAPIAVSQSFLRIEEVRARCVAERSAAPLLALGELDWNTQQWIRFLADLEVDAHVLEQIDERFHLTDSRNREIAFLWLLAAVRADYRPAYPAVERFLLSVGRRKFLKPLYEALLQRPGGAERAASIYQRARPRYHAVARRTLDELLPRSGS